MKRINWQTRRWGFKRTLRCRYPPEHHDKIVLTTDHGEGIGLAVIRNDEEIATVFLRATEVDRLVAAFNDWQRRLPRARP